MTAVEQKLNSLNYLRSSKPFWNALAITYTLLGYYAGIGLLIATSFLLNALGIVIVTHTLVLSAYLAHEFTHGTIFRSMKLNTLAGEVAQWLNGACYCSFRNMSRRHIAHHIEKADHADCDLLKLLRSFPKLIQWFILALEWFCFPALFFLLQWRAITAPYWNLVRRGERLRVTTMLLIRGAMFALLGWVSPKALLLYFLCFMGMVTVIRLVDAFQHDYETIPIGEIAPEQNLDYEQFHTFSTLFTKRWKWINLLLLNFGYHNAHHALMKCPWHSLPELHEELSQRQKILNIDLVTLLIFFHQHRMKRIFLGEGEALNDRGELDMSKFYGALGGTAILLPAQLIE
ncbi:Fatty acid desaturase [Hyella patelloides LEGE 07179]|uniref:Fatty acid desaturase n=1 Tax=Hyella patelloides LEGE 07179 TaxID=945734 RepID=A0A563VK21_9CYAN|nr:fatty acid desaturase [Hyella patelloides]VEP11836.1 Fatty acid desaturase [Hyella patelloides LEGE 07179]